MRLIDADYLSEKMIPNCPIEEGGIPLPDFATHIKILGMYPTVDAIPVVHGRWEIKWNAEFVDPFGETDEIPSAVCPFCGHEEFYVAYDDDWAKPHNYCPNCGAKMDGGNNG